MIEARGNSANGGTAINWPVVKWNATTPTWSIDQWVTPEMAREKRASAAFPRQRVMRARHVAHIAEQMELGFYSSIIEICVLPDGKEYLTNGNHTLEGLQQFGDKYWLTIKYIFKNNMKEVNQQYAHTDIGAKRSNRDQLRAFYGVEDSTWRQYVFAGAKCLLTDLGRNRQLEHGIEEQKEYYEKYQQAGEILREALEDGSQSSWLKQAPIIAVALCVINEQPEKGAEFFHAAAHDDGLPQGHGAKALLYYLTKQKTKRRGTARAVLYAKATVAAWNAFFRGEQISYIKPETMIKVRIAGTSFKDERKVKKKKRD